VHVVHSSRFHTGKWGWFPGSYYYPISLALALALSLLLLLCLSFDRMSFARNSGLGYCSFDVPTDIVSWWVVGAHVTLVGFTCAVAIASYLVVLSQVQRSLRSVDTIMSALSHQASVSPRVDASAPQATVRVPFVKAERNAHHLRSVRWRCWALVLSFAIWAVHIVHVMLQSLLVVSSPVVVAFGLVNTVLLCTMGIWHFFLYTTTGRRQHVWSVVWKCLDVPSARDSAHDIDREQFAALQYAPPLPDSSEASDAISEDPNLVAATAV
jgi:hypothetical protein